MKPYTQLHTRVSPVPTHGCGGVGGGQWVVWGLWLWLVDICGDWLGLWVDALVVFGWVGRMKEEHKGINNLCFDKACKINDLCVFIFVIFLNVLNMFSNLNFHNNYDILIIDIDQLFNQAQKLSDGLKDLKDHLQR